MLLTLPAFNILFIFFSIIYLIFYLIEPSYGESVSLIIFLFSILLYFYFLSKINKYIFKNWLSPSNFLLLGLIIVNLQSLLNIYFEFGDVGLYLENPNYENIKAKILYLSLLGINFYLLGVMNLKKRPQIKLGEIKIHILKPWPWLILLTFIYFFLNIDVASFLDGSIYRGSGAFDKEREDSEFAENLLNVFFTIYLGLYSYNTIIKKNKLSILSFAFGISVIFWIPFIAYLILRAMSGDRGPVIYNALLLFYAYFICCKPQIKLFWFLTLFILGAFVISLLGTVRSLSSDIGFGEKVSTALEMKDNRIPSISPPTQELANSIKCNFIAVSDIEEGITDYRYGLNTLYNISTAVPGSYTFSREVLAIDPTEYSTSIYLTRSLQGYDYRYGLGMTTFSEFYLDGGLIGIIVGFFFLGLLFRFVDYIILSPNIYSIYIVLFALKLASISVYIPRSSMGYGISKGLYCVIVFFFFNYIFKLIKGKN